MSGHTKNYARSIGLMSFLELRKMIGIVSISIPIQILVMVGYLSSISYSYYTNYRNMFVANLAMIGSFLICDHGYDAADTVANIIAGVCSLLVAFNPCESHELFLGLVQQHYVHYTAAGILFTTLGCISCFLFVRSTGVMTEMKKLRNKIYRSCGIAIFSGIALIIWFSYKNWYIFAPEILCLCPFSFSWLTKGGMWLKDKTVTISSQ